MAERGRTLSRFVSGSILAAIGVAGCVLGALAALLMSAGRGGDALADFADPHVWRALRFTLIQAGLSTCLSLALGVGAARAFYRRGAFTGRSSILTLLSVPIVLPSLIAIFGLVTIYGRNGILSRGIDWMGLDLRWNLYGLGGILLAHVFFNLPLATRLLLPAWYSIPAETWRLSEQLGMRGLSAFLLIEWPVLRRYLPQVAATLFLITATSFAVILTLGGGPRAATLEVVIFEALRFEADPPRAARLAILSLGLCLLALLAAQMGSRAAPLGSTLAVAPSTLAGRRGAWLDSLWIGLALLIVVPPMAAAMIDGFFGIAAGGLAAAALARAVAISLALGLPAGLLATGAAFLIASGEAKAGRRHQPMAGWLRMSGALPIALSPMALALGLYLLLGEFSEGRARTITGIILMNSLIAVPFLAALLRPALERGLERNDQLCRALGIGGWARWRLIDWPSLRGALGSALALGVALSLGDLVAVGLYGDPAIRTLSLLLYDQLSAYRMQGAAATALVLMVVVFATYRLIEWGMGKSGAA